MFRSVGLIFQTKTSLNLTEAVPSWILEEKKVFVRKVMLEILDLKKGNFEINNWMHIWTNPKIGRTGLLASSI